MSEKYISNHFDDITKYASVIEKRLDDECNINDLMQDNAKALELCQKNNLNFLLIDDEYKIEIDL